MVKRITPNAVPAEEGEAAASPTSITTDISFGSPNIVYIKEQDSTRVLQDYEWNDKSLLHGAHAKVLLPSFGATVKLSSGVEHDHTLFRVYYPNQVSAVPTFNITVPFEFAATLTTLEQTFFSFMELSKAAKKLGRFWGAQPKSVVRVDNNDNETLYISVKPEKMCRNLEVYDGRGVGAFTELTESHKITWADLMAGDTVAFGLTFSGGYCNEMDYGVVLKVSTIILKGRNPVVEQGHKERKAAYMRTQEVDMTKMF